MSEWMHLWRFLREAFPDQAAKIDEYNSTNGRPGEEWAAARSELLNEFPMLPIERTHAEVVQLIKMQVHINRLKLKNDIDQLYREELPRLAKTELRSGRWEITGKPLTGDHARMSLTVADLVALRIDIEHGQLIGSAGSYGEIAIRRRRVMDIDGQPPERPLSREEVRRRVRSEMKRQAAENQLCKSMRAEADYLAKWVAERIEGNDNKLFTLAETIRTNQDFSGLYKELRETSPPP